MIGRGISSSDEDAIIFQFPLPLLMAKATGDYSIDTSLIVHKSTSMNLCSQMLST